MNTELEIGLKKQIAKQSYLKKEAIRQNETFETALLQSWSLLLTHIGKHALTDIIWNFVETSSISVTIKIPSHKIGIFSVVKNYTNKHGKTHLAHFSVYGTYLRKAIEDKPISYPKYVDVKNYKKILDVQMDKIHTAKSVCELFALKKKKLIIQD